MVRPLTGAPPIVVITGPTATGKSRTALAVAHAFIDRGAPACILSADSVQVYRYMDIGTDKLPLADREGVPHHLLDVVDPDQTFSAAAFSRRADEIIAETRAAGGAVVVTGGTGFYLRALLWGLFPGPSANAEIRRRLTEEAEAQGLEALHQRLKELDPESALAIHPRDSVRIIRALEVFELTGETRSRHFARQQRGPRYQALVIGLDLERKLMYDRINARVTQMIERGLTDEVKKLRARGYGPELKSQQALGYKQVHQFLDGKFDLPEAVGLIQRETRHYARRQLTWLRKEPGLHWTSVAQREKIIASSLQFIEERT